MHHANIIIFILPFFFSFRGTIHSESSCKLRYWHLCHGLHSVAGFKVVKSRSALSQPRGKYLQGLLWWGKFNFKFSFSVFTYWQKNKQTNKPTKPEDITLSNASAAEYVKLYMYSVSLSSTTAKNRESVVFLSNMCILLNESAPSTTSQRVTCVIKVPILDAYMHTAWRH